jgi:renal tumor antigen
MEEERIRKVMMQLLLTADMIHRKGIYHRDLKPENILILDKSDL